MFNVVSHRCPVNRKESLPCVRCHLTWVKLFSLICLNILLNNLLKTRGKSHVLERPIPLTSQVHHKLRYVGIVKRRLFK